MAIRAGSVVCLLAVLLTVFFTPTVARAQNWSFDARTIALGGVGGGSGNIAASLIDEQKPYRSIVIPLGLLQVLKDFGKFNPDSDDFDPVRAAEYAASPIHFVVGRDGTNTQNLFVTDVLNGELSRDLNDYAGFVPARELVAEGLANPSWGKTIKFRENSGGFQGVYIGAGPYLSMQSRALVDDQLRSILDSDVPLYIPNTSFPLSNTTATQLALAITGGYRARLPLPAGMGSGGVLEGLYVAANYNYLRGFRYESFDTALRLDTDRGGLLTLNPALPGPLKIARDSATSGNGFAIDVGTAVVVDRWQFGFGANGLGNRIEWTGLQRTLYQLDATATATSGIRPSPWLKPCAWNCPSTTAPMLRTTPTRGAPSPSGPMASRGRRSGAAWRRSSSGSRCAAAVASSAIVGSRAAALGSTSPIASASTSRRLAPARTQSASATSRSPFRSA